MDKEYKTINIKELKAYEKNNKKHWANVDEIVKSIQANTYITPIVVDENYVILAWHGRKLAMDKLQITEADVLVVSWLSETQKRDFRIRDNKLTELSEWDFDNLRIELDELDIPELSDLFKDEEELEEEVEAKEDDYEIPEVITTDIVLWDLFEIGEHRLLCGDSTDAEQVAQLMNGEKADMVFTDPPYWVSYTGWNKFEGWKMKSNGREMIKNDDIDLYEDAVVMCNTFCEWPVFMWFADTVCYWMYRWLEKVWAEIVALIIWKKKGWYWAMWASYKPNHEPCLIWKPKGAKLNFIWSTTENRVWEEDKEWKNKLHPTQKPVMIPARAIANHKADKVLDLFWWSGSTMVACHQLNRKCYMSELDPKYVQTIVNRMIKLDPEIKIKKNWVEYNHATGDYTLLDK